jgi:acyl carrier protein
MSEAVILGKLQTIISNQLGIEEAKVVPSADFTKELNADSLDVVELVMAFEEEFDIEIEDEIAGDMSTVQDALDYITKQTA